MTAAEALEGAQLLVVATLGGWVGVSFVIRAIRALFRAAAGNSS